MSGARLVVVTHVEKNLVTVDANHPLAGRALHFEVAIAAVWDATRQEVEHRQVHGAGRPRHH